MNDLIAGVIVGIVALPLAIAFAIASGVSPDRGLYTAIVAGFIISALGGSRVQIGGPTGAFVVIVYGIVQKYGYDGLAVATVMAGIFLVVLGVARLGAVIKFIPHPVVVGFTSGIAVIIFSNEVKDFLGLEMGAVPADFIEKWRAFIEHFTAINPYAIAVSGIALGDHSRLAADQPANPRAVRRADRLDRHRAGAALARRDDRHAVRRHQRGAAASRRCRTSRSRRRSRSSGRRSPSRCSARSSRCCRRWLPTA